MSDALPSTALAVGMPTGADPLLILDALELRHAMDVEREQTRACTDYAMACISAGARIPFEDCIAHLLPPERVEARRAERASIEATLRQMREMEVFEAWNESHGYGGKE